MQRTVADCGVSRSGVSVFVAVRVVIADDHPVVRDGLTGMLLYCSQSFLQMLEGEGTALEDSLVTLGPEAYPDPPPLKP